MHFVFYCICAAIFCLVTSSLSAHSSAVSYSSCGAVFLPYYFSHSAAAFSSAVSLAVALILAAEFLDLAVVGLWGFWRIFEKGISLKFLKRGFPPKIYVGFWRIFKIKFRGFPRKTFGQKKNMRQKYSSKI